MILKCHFCNAEIKINAKFCPECGQKVVIIQQAQPQQVVKMILTIDGAADFLSVSKPTIYKLMSLKSNPLPFFPMCSDKRFITSEIIEWAKKNQTSLRELHATG